MKLLLLLKLNTNELIKLGSGLYAIGTSLYDIVEDLTKVQKEHGMLIIGVVMVIKAIPELAAKIKEVKAEIETDERIVSTQNEPKQDD